MQPKPVRSPVRWPILIVVGLLAIAVWQHQAIHDWISLRNYDAPGPVIKLADDISVTNKARRLFYINHPSVEDRSSFNTSCSSQGEHTIVLGCYHPVDRGIFIFHVTDTRLNGVDQVTAAHEMLHAAYDRLNSKDRSHVDAMLQNYYDHDLKDPRVLSIIAAYKKSEPHDVVNEMHSVFGTEVAALPSDLEAYYAQYFIKRATVVQYASDYQAEFTSRQNQVTDADNQLKTMKQQIDTNTVTLDQQEAQIKQQRQQLDTYKSNDNINAYNNAVPAYNARIDSYNQLITTTKTLLSDYNRLVGDRNQIALQVTDLAHSIDSSFQPISQ